MSDWKPGDLTGTLREHFEVGAGTRDPSAAFQVHGNSMGSLPYPRLTTSERTAISTPASGLMVFDTDLDKLQLYSGGAWADVGGGGGAVYVDLTGANKITTGSIPDGGGGSGHFHITITNGTCLRLRVKALSNTTNATIEFFSDSGLAVADRLYLASNKNCYASPYHQDGTPWSIPFFGAALTGDALYWQITNQGLNASIFEIEMMLTGEV